MPTGVYERTAKHRAINSRAHMGLTPTPETLAKMSAAQTGHVYHKPSAAGLARMRVGNLKHGLSQCSAYSRWANMHQRCGNPNDKSYRHYGGRGIAVCERWRSFENFYADMGDPPVGMSIDRIDNDGNYEPSNCRWATSAQQNSNKQRTTLTMADVESIRSGTKSQRRTAEEFGISQTMVSHIRAGRRRVLI